METVERLAPQHASGILREGVLSIGSKLLPHDTARTTCPPAALVSGDGPLIVVPSIMRSGTHLLLDSLFNNFPGLRRKPLFVDFDAYARAGLPVPPLASVQGVVIKTHFPQVQFAEPYASTLAALAARAFVIRPWRPAVQIRKPLAKWGINLNAQEFSELERRFEDFWAPYSPRAVEFSTLLDPEGVMKVIRLVQEGAKIQPYNRRSPIMPAQTRLGVYLDKVLTRCFGCRVPRVNTTIGYRLWPENL